MERGWGDGEIRGWGDKGMGGWGERRITLSLIWPPPHLPTAPSPHHIKNKKA